eukprot:m.108833 g.108833  ORF g.108833 m.108833 type:complete len:349 (+) comp12722_c2_seq1:104-1150(+)
MGCFHSLLGAQDGADGRDEQPKTYSWDTREQKDPSNFRFKDLKKENKAKLAGDVGNEQFNIENCEGCNLFIFDQISTVFIDDCKNCNIFIGPVKTSMFIRNCTDCNILAVCQQYRTRDCERISSALCCQTLPIIESSTEMAFHCFRGNYFALAAQMKNASIVEYNNNWSRIHDFTPNKDEPNFTTHTASPRWLDEFVDVAKETAPSVVLDVDNESATVPLTTSPGTSPNHNSHFLVVFPPHTKHLRKVLRELNKDKAISMVQTRQAKVTGTKCETIFHCEHAGELQTACGEEGGQVTSFEVSGETAPSTIDHLCDSLELTAVYKSSQSSTVHEDMKAFYVHTESIRDI